MLRSTQARKHEVLWFAGAHVRSPMRMKFAWRRFSVQTLQTVRSVSTPFAAAYEDACVQVQVVGLRLVDVAGAAAGDGLGSMTPARPWARRLSRSRLLRAERRRAALVVGDLLHAASSGGRAVERAGALVDLLERHLRVPMRQTAEERRPARCGVAGGRIHGQWVVEAPRLARPSRHAAGTAAAPSR